MKELMALVVSLGIGAGGTFFYLNEKIENLEKQLKIAREGRPPAYGILSRVNRVELETVSSPFKCQYLDGGFPVFKGEILYFWDFEYAYGVVVPPNYDWQVKDLGNGTAEVTAPELAQLRPIKVEFTDFIELNEANGDRWERMYIDVKGIGQQWIKHVGDERLLIDSSSWSEAKSSLQDLLLPLVNQARESANQTKFSTVQVKFENEPADFNGKAKILPKNCENLT